MNLYLNYQMAVIALVEEKIMRKLDLLSLT